MKVARRVWTKQNLFILKKIARDSEKVEKANGLVQQITAKDPKDVTEAEKKEVISLVNELLQSSNEEIKEQAQGMQILLAQANIITVTP